MRNKYAIRNIITGLLMLVISLWLTSSQLVFGWVAAIFFASITVLLITRYFKSAPSVEDTGSTTNGLTVSGNETSSLTNDDGIFTYNESGFSLHIQRNFHVIEWKKIKSMVAYKMDRFASDDISLDVFCEGNISFSISEETPGWSHFLDNSRRALPAIDKFWEIEMATPGLEINLAVIFDRQNRSFKEIEKEYYNN